MSKQLQSYSGNTERKKELELTIIMSIVTILRNARVAQRQDRRHVLAFADTLRLLLVVVGLVITGLCDTDHWRADFLALLRHFVVFDVRRHEGRQEQGGESKRCR